jgi:pyruvate-ferredoxin/flavodoxin oxidoreductase
MVTGVFGELAAEHPRRRFTVGIDDDVSRSSIDWDRDLDIEPPDTLRAVFFGLGSDGTVGANKNTIKILGSEPDLNVQGYFVYDSKKSGSQTVSHLRFGRSPIRAPYLVTRAGFISCSHAPLLEREEVLDRAAPGAVLLLNTPATPAGVWDTLPRRVQEQILVKGVQVHVVDADRVAEAAGLPGRTNIVLQTCFFALSGVLEHDRAVVRIRAAVEKSYGPQGAEVVAANLAAVDRALEGLARAEIPEAVTSVAIPRPRVPADAPEFAQQVTATLLAGHGDRLPVSALPPDGTWPSGTAAFEKRNLADLVAEWDPDLCIQCGNCSFVCPHGVIRSTFYDSSTADGAPEGFRSAPLNARGVPDAEFTLQVYAEDCTGCGLCVEACPVTAPGDAGHKAINLTPRAPRAETERRSVAFFETIPFPPRERVDFGTVRGTQFLQPLFEFSGACAGCGETPYLTVLSRLFGDRAVIANATGCSSIYGGNLPTTPWTKNAEGRGPAWSNSLFEDDAEYGLGLRLAADQHTTLARERLSSLAEDLGPDLVQEILDAPQRNESDLAAQRARLAVVTDRLAGDERPEARDLAGVLDHLVRRSVWIVGGDGWAYDIGSAGLDHVLAGGRDVNILVLDTEVYSNTGGQMSKATPLGAVATFAAGGKSVEKKDLALQAISYGSVYVARVAMGADPQQTLTALREAEAFDGPSLVIAYCHCIEHGIDMRTGLDQQSRAVSSGYWPLLRYDPVLRSRGENPFLLDSGRPRIPLSDYTRDQRRFTTLARTDPPEAARLAALAQHAVDLRWQTYEEMATQPAHKFPADARPGAQGLSRAPGGG